MSKEKKQTFRGLSSDQVDKLQSAFAKQDKDDDGRLSSKELGGLLKKLNSNLSKSDKSRGWSNSLQSLKLGSSQLEEITTIIDVDASGFVEFGEFVRLMSLVQAFQNADEDHDGHVNHSELKRILKVSEENASALLKASDADEDEQLDFYEFILLLGKHKLFHKKKKEGDLRDVRKKFKHLSEKEIKFYRSCFSAFDIDQSGSITKLELRHVMRACNKSVHGKKSIKVSGKQLDEIISDLDVNQDAELDFEEFLTLMALSQTFRKADVNNDGSVTLEELIKVMKGVKSSGQKLSERQIKKLFDRGDSDGDSQLNYHEFVVLLAKTHLFHQKKTREMMKSVKKEKKLKKKKEKEKDDDDKEEFMRMQHMISSAQHMTQDKRARFIKVLGVTEYDENNEGVIKIKRLKKVLAKLGHFGAVPTDEQVSAVMKLIDEQGNGEVKYDAFFKLVATTASFEAADKDTTGYVTNPQLHALLSTMGGMFDNQEIECFVDRVHTESKSRLNFHEFVELAFF